MSDSTTAFILVPDGPHAGAWAKQMEHFSRWRDFVEGASGSAVFFYRDKEAEQLVAQRLGGPARRLPIEVSPSPEHWAKLLALVIVDQARVVIL